MEKRIRTIKINIKGDLQKYWTEVFLKTKIRLAGIKIREITHKSSHHSEVTLTGEEAELWKVLSWAKAPRLFFRLDEVKFHFED